MRWRIKWRESFHVLHTVIEIQSKLMFSKCYFIKIVCALHGYDSNAFSPRTNGNVFLRFCIVYCSQGNREQPAHYLKQYKNAGKCFRVYGALKTK